MLEPVRVLHFWEKLRASYWFVPALLTLTASALAGTTVTLDHVLQDEYVEGLGWAYGGGPDGAQAVLSTIAGSMITVAGVVFSLTMVTLTLASSQFGPRLLRNFMRDWINQIVLGVFVATFLFCLLVLRTVSNVERAEFVPHISVSVAVLLSVFSMGVLIYFFHHVSTSIQVSHVIRAAADEVSVAIDRLFPQELGDEEPSIGEVTKQWPDDFSSQSELVRSTGDGYIQAVDTEGLLAVARRADLVLRLVCGPGHYCIRSTPLVEAWPTSRVDESVASQLVGTFVLGRQRSPIQDVAFAASQLTEVAVRALSPGINDPFTAIMCIDALASALRKMAGRSLPSPYRFDEEEQLRVVAHPVRFGMVLEASMTPIYEYGRHSTLVAQHLLKAVEALASCARRDEDRNALTRLADRIHAGSRDEQIDAVAQRMLDAQRESAAAALEKSPLPEKPFENE